MKRILDNKGSTTVFLTFAFLSIMIFIIGIISLLRFRWEKTHMTRLCNISAETQLSKYYRPLFDGYRLFYYIDAETEAVNADMMAEFVGNQEKVPDILKVKPSMLSISEKYYATDNKCHNVLEQINECAKYCCAEKAYDSFKEKYLNELNKHGDDSDNLSDISDEIKQYEKDAEIEEDMIELLKLVEGITVLGGCVHCEDVFVKQGIYGEVTADNAGIDNSKVWQAVSLKAFNIKNMLNHPKKFQHELIVKMKMIHKKNDEAIEIAGRILKKISARNDVKLICDVKSFRQNIIENNNIIDELLNFEGKKDLSETDIAYYDELLKAYHVKDLRFDYSMLVVKKTNDPRNKTGYMGESILSFLIDTEKLSKMAMIESRTYEKVYKQAENFERYEYEHIGFENTESLKEYINCCKECCVTETFKNNINLQLYIDMFFRDYMNRKKDSENSIQYEKEYIIAGKESDIENLKAVVNRLILIRSAQTFLYLIRNETYRTEAYMAAVSLVGFTGMDALVRCVQYMLLGLWAYEDSCIDIGVLLSGKKIDAIKKTVNISFPELVLFSKEFVKEKINMAKGSGQMGYDVLVRLLLSTQSDKIKLFRIMDLIQVNMKIKHDRRFSFQNALFGMKVRYVCHSPFLNEIEAKYSY